MSKLTAAFGYCRVAPNQLIKPQYTLEAQKLRCLARADENGAVLINIYEEEASGMTLARPRLRELFYDMAKFRTGSADVHITLITHDPSRLARDVNHYFRLQRRADTRLKASFSFTRISFEEVDND